MIYLDHAATSWPKPPEVIRAMTDFLERAGGNPGRSGHRLSVEAGRIVYDGREAVAELLGAADPLRVIFTLNATHALNIVVRGLLQPGDRVVTTGIEHNAVMRPLRAIKNVPGDCELPGTWTRGIDLTVVPCAADGTLDLAAFAPAVKPGTRLVIATHASNVTGTILPVAEIAAIAHRAGALVLVDAAQTAGVLPIDVQALGIDLLVFTGHKGLLGPPGTGGLVIGDGVNTARLAPLMRGGTGSRSEREYQPEDLPDKYESGTPNGVGLAGLGAGVRFVLARGVDAIRSHEQALTAALVEGLSAIPGVTVYGPSDPAQRTATVSFTVAGRRVSEIGLRLDEEADVLCRVGLHCAPAAHRTIGTFPEGAIRFAAGLSTSLEDAARAVEAVAKIVAA
ncbi:MAG: aminotransferase class V-fold PLP-dependent enzyme [Chloroflexi bacterium]|nr:aminotransferase class V-fold PLP-dependent enzyme [Chloroflexota bacterium]